jgi:hypothetical protein
MVSVSNVGYASTFETTITPVLSKAGCNRGSCHGAASGRGGFHLSLYGSDPRADYREISQQLGGRRIQLAVPSRSLLLLKATETVEHGGGQRLLAQGEGAKRIETWIQRGAHWVEPRQNLLDEQSSDSSETVQGELTVGLDNKTSVAKEIRLLDLKVDPSQVVVNQVGESISLRSVARFTDGHSEDVTRWTVFTPEDASAVVVDPETATVMVQRNGRHVIIARYLSRVVPIEILVPNETPEKVDASFEEQWASTAPVNLVDQYVGERLQTLRIPVSPRCDDLTFLRRSSLDLVGRLPTSQSIEEFLNWDQATRRSEWIDSLLDSDAFNDYWALQFAKLFRIRKLANGDLALKTYHDWLREQLEKRVGYDKVTMHLLTARGNVERVGPANFLRTADGARERAELVSEVFMGSRLRCANCHDHPLDRWTQDDYHGLAAIFATVRVGQEVSEDPTGKVVHPKTGRNAVPKLPGQDLIGHELAIHQTAAAVDRAAPVVREMSTLAGDDRVADHVEGRSFDEDVERTLPEQFATWLVDPSHPFFSRAIVNRLWRHLMGRGFVEPVDDFRETNPATHPRLLEALAESFVKEDYDLRGTLRRIALSDAYQRSSVAMNGNRSDAEFYSHYYQRNLQAEVHADAISDVLDIPEQYGDAPLGTRAVDLFDPGTASRSLDILGRCLREASCEQGEGEDASSRLQAKLYALNGELLNERLQHSGPLLNQLFNTNKPMIEVVEILTRRALQRPLTVAERDFWASELKSQPELNRTQWLQDFVWSLLNCHEFTTNH